MRDLEGKNVVKVVSILAFATLGALGLVFSDSEGLAWAAFALTTLILIV